MKKSVIILWLAAFFFVEGFAQNAPKIQRAYAFYTMSTPGMAMTDDKGNVINPSPIIDRFIYVECPGTKMPDIRMVTYDGIGYAATPAKENENQIHVGQKADAGKEVILNARKGNTFWKLGLQLKKENDKAPKEVKHIVIRGREVNRSYTINLYNETRLSAPDRY